MQTLGLCLMVACFPLWLTAHIQLGSSFSALPQKHSALVRRTACTQKFAIRFMYSARLSALPEAFSLRGGLTWLLVFAMLIPLHCRSCECGAKRECWKKNSATSTEPIAEQNLVLEALRRESDRIIPPPRNTAMRHFRHSVVGRSTATPGKTNLACVSQPKPPPLCGCI